MKHVYIVGEYRSIAWFGPTQPRPFRHPVCAYEAGVPDDIEFAEQQKSHSLKRYDRDGIFGARIEEFEDGKSREEFELQERIAEAAERRAMQPREYYYAEG